MNIGILTSSRADFGIYRPLIDALNRNQKFKHELIVFGSHLSNKNGNSIEDILNEEYKVHHKIETFTEGDSPSSISNSIGTTIIKFSSFWKKNHCNFDIVFCLGDRFEMFAAVYSGVPYNIKFAHIHGGEKTLGSFDNMFRHSISHASFIHFASTKNHKKKLLKILDNKKNIHFTGSLALENIKKTKLLSIENFYLKWGINLGYPTILVTFHPETINYSSNLLFAEEISNAILEKKNFQYLITLPNNDTYGNLIRSHFINVFKTMKNIFLVENLGSQSYYTAMKYSKFLLGNSSSGIIEAPSFNKYFINLGDRQNGREVNKNVLNIKIKKELIVKSINKISHLGDYKDDNVYKNNSVNPSSIILKVLNNYEK